jgi:hypothetical protein
MEGWAMRFPVWDGHKKTLEQHRVDIRKIINQMWTDAVIHLPYVEEDPYINTTRRQVEDAHMKLFSLLDSMNDALQTECIRRANQ